MNSRWVCNEAVMVNEEKKYQKYLLRINLKILFEGSVRVGVVTVNKLGNLTSQKWSRVINHCFSTR